MTTNILKKSLSLFLTALVVLSIGACNKGAIPSDQGTVNTASPSSNAKKGTTSDVVNYDLPKIPGFTPTGDPEMDFELLQEALFNLQVENPDAYLEIKSQLPPNILTGGANLEEHIVTDPSGQGDPNVKVIPYEKYLQMTDEQRAFIDANPDKYIVKK